MAEQMAGVKVAAPTMGTDPFMQHLAVLAGMVREKNAEPQAKKVHIAEVIRHGKQLVIPEGMGFQEAIEVLQRRMQFEQEPCEIRETINAFVWDGALALSKAMTELFGWATPEAKEEGFFIFKEKKPPTMISVEVDVDQTVLVPMGEFSLPGIEGRVGTNMIEKDGRIVFEVYANVLRKYEPQIRELITLARKYAKEESVYRGKAVKITMRSVVIGGREVTMPEIKFIDLKHVNEQQLVLSDDVMSAVTTSVFTPIEKSAECRQHGIPLKRGVLLSGPYGTGKTLACYITAKKCVRNKWTFLYCNSADELADVVKFAHAYQPAVVFCEDIDRVMDGERDADMDDILNIIDGIESKNTEIMVILTTNHVEKINQAMLRPGRLDAVINVLPPDAKAVEKLIRLYGKDLIPENADLTAAAEQLKGKIPAVIRECIERAKLSALKMNEGALILTGEAILDAAVGMRNQLDLLEPKRHAGVRETVERAVGKALTQGADLEAALQNGKN